MLLSRVHVLKLFMEPFWFHFVFKMEKSKRYNIRQNLTDKCAEIVKIKKKNVMNTKFSVSRF